MLGQAVRAAAQLPSRAATGATSTPACTPAALSRAERDLLQSIPTSRRRTSPTRPLRARLPLHRIPAWTHGRASHPVPKPSRVVIRRSGSRTVRIRLFSADGARQTLDYGALPVGTSRRSNDLQSSADTARSASRPSRTPRPSSSHSSKSCRLSPRTRSITKRAGLLLYGLQVASANAKHVMLHSNSVRSITYTGDGIPLAPQEYGWDLEDIEAEYEEDEESSED